MDKKKEIQRRFGQRMTDAQYMSLGYALDELENYLIEKACNVLNEISGLPLHYEEYLQYQNEYIETFRTKMKE